MGVHDRLDQEGRHLTAGDRLTVAWWHERAGRIASWLLVGPPPAPLTGGAWLQQLAVARGPGGWAVASQPALGPMPDGIAERLRDPFGPAGDARSAVLRPDGERLPGDAGDDLRAECAEAALALVARRLAEPVAARDSGVVLLRLRDDGHLEVAPARDEDGWLGRSVLVDLAGARLEDSPLEQTGVQFGDASVTLGEATLELPVASVALARPGRRAAIELTLPTLWRSGLPEPAVTLELTAAPR